MNNKPSNKNHSQKKNNNAKKKKKNTQNRNNRFKDFTEVRTFAPPKGQNLKENFIELRSQMDHPKSVSALTDSISIINATLLAHMGKNGRLNSDMEKQVLELGNYLIDQYPASALEKADQNWPQGSLLFRVYDALKEEAETAEDRKFFDALPESVQLKLIRIMADIADLQGDKEITISMKEEFAKILLDEDEDEKDWMSIQLPFFSRFITSALTGQEAAGIIVNCQKNRKTTIRGLRISKGTIEPISIEELIFAYTHDAQTGEEIEMDPSLNFAEFSMASLNQLN